jgi:hypothetical protein
VTTPFASPPGGSWPASRPARSRAALNNDVTRIASFDGGFDQVKGIERLSLD